MNSYFLCLRNPNIDGTNTSIYEESIDEESIDEYELTAWPTYSVAKQLYLTLSPNMTSLSVNHHFIASRVAFWENISPLLEECSSNLASYQFVFLKWNNTCFCICAFIFINKYI